MPFQNLKKTFCIIFIVRNAFILRIQNDLLYLFILEFIIEAMNV